ncbi:hypothetical protein FB451DRAFT_1174507 [Mycena latifolia]|nr:hypothetical protein FB451DRAFT_1174507 [Mycena latifolia]
MAPTSLFLGLALHAWQSWLLGEACKLGGVSLPHEVDRGRFSWTEVFLHSDTLLYHYVPSSLLSSAPDSNWLWAFKPSIVDDNECLGTLNMTPRAASSFFNDSRSAHNELRHTYTSYAT